MYTQKYTKTYYIFIPLDFKTFYSFNFILVSLVIFAFRYSYYFRTNYGIAIFIHFPIRFYMDQSLEFQVF